MTDLIQGVRDIRELERKVQEHFNQFRWRLMRLEFPEEGDNDQRVFAIPADSQGEIEDELDAEDISKEFYTRLREIGREYGISLTLPCSIYMK